MLYFSKLENIKIFAPTLKDLWGVFNALCFLKKDSRNFKYIRKLKVIAVRPKYSYNNQTFYNQRAWILEQGTIREANVTYLASLILHESFHIFQNEKGMDNRNFRAEPAAYRKQIAFLRKHKDLIGAKYVTSLYKEKFWEKNYTKRNKKGEFLENRPLIRFLESYKKAPRKFVPLKCND